MTIYERWQVRLIDVVIKALWAVQINTYDKWIRRGAMPYDPVFAWSRLLQELMNSLHVVAGAYEGIAEAELRTLAETLKDE